MTEGWEERAGRELDITESIEKETNEREREKMKPSNGEEKPAKGENARFKGKRIYTEN